MKVLIVDDEIDLSLLLKSYFVKKGFTVLTSHTLQDGIQKMEHEHPDIMLLDNNLPDATGWKVAPTIVSHYPNLYLILISAFHPTEPIMPAQAKFKVLEKPISFSVFDEHLETMIGAKEKQQETT